VPFSGEQTIENAPVRDLIKLGRVAGNRHWVAANDYASDDVAYLQSRLVCRGTWVESFDCNRRLAASVLADLVHY
jgi:hypothetical protein